MSDHTKRNQRVAGLTNTPLQKKTPHEFSAEEIRKKCINAVLPLRHCQFRSLILRLAMLAQTLLKVHVPYRVRGVKFGLFIFCLFKSVMIRLENYCFVCCCPTS